MQKSKTAWPWGIVLLLAFGCLLASACSTPSCALTGGCWPGEVRADAPEVFTRERLVRRRFEAQTALEEELKKSLTLTSTIQGSRGYQSFSGLYSKFEAKFDPLGGAVNTAQLRQQARQIEQQSELAKVQHETEMTKAETELLKLKEEQKRVREAIARGETVAPSATASQPSTTPAGNQPQSTTNVSAPTPGPSAFQSKPDLPTLANPPKTDAQLTSVEGLRDRMAYRNAVEAMLRETELDDTHDLAGDTIYTLKFDLTVLPGDDPEALAEVRFTLAPPNSSNSEESLPISIPDLQRAFKDQILREVQIVQERVRLSYPPIAQFPFGGDPPPRCLYAYPKAGQPGDNEEICKKEEKSAFIEKAVQAIKEHYQPSQEALECSLLKDLILKQEDEKEGGFFAPEIKLEEAPQQWQACLGKLNQKGHSYPYIYTVEPKEYAQNISDVAAVESLKTLVLSVAATLPQSGLNLGNYTEQTTRTNHLLSTILRRPLAVGYGTGRNQFGWIIGPKFEIDEDGNIQFRQALAQQSFQASIVAPAWWPSTQMTGEYRWLDQSGHPISDFKPLWPESRPMTVRLPANSADIVDAIFERGKRRPPLIAPRFEPAYLPPWEPDKNKRYFLVQAGRRATLYIRGFDLWRSPRIYLGSQEADNVKIMPDMEGIIAIFNSVEEFTLDPAFKGTFPARFDLSVITSNGADTLRNAVLVLPLNPLPATSDGEKTKKDDKK